MGAAMAAKDGDLAVPVEGVGAYPAHTMPSLASNHVARDMKVCS